MMSLPRFGLVALAASAVILPLAIAHGGTASGLKPASAFASILIYAMELLPHRVGLIGGLFYGLNFGLGGIAAALLGILADRYGVQTVYTICSFLPLAGLLTWFLPKIENAAA